MSVINGSDLMLFVGGKSIAYATTCKITLSADTTDTSSKDVDAGWTNKQIKKLSWTLSSENLNSDDGEGVTYDDLFALMVAKAAIVIVFAAKTTSTDNNAPVDGWVPKANTGYTGNALLTSLEKTAPDNDNSTFTVSLDGTGKLSKVLAV